MESLLPDGSHQTIALGMNLEQGEVPFHVVPAKTIFGSHLKGGEGYAVVSCAVAPGFDFEDFELFSAEELLKSYPQHPSIIEKLT